MGVLASIEHTVVSILMLLPRLLSRKGCAQINASTVGRIGGAMNRLGHAVKMVLPSCRWPHLRRRWQSYLLAKTQLLQTVFEKGLTESTKLLL
jgi:hypothetical protein